MPPLFQTLLALPLSPSLSRFNSERVPDSEGEEREGDEEDAGEGDDDGDDGVSDDDAAVDGSGGGGAHDVPSDDEIDVSHPERYTPPDSGKRPRLAPSSTSKPKKKSSSVCC